MHLKVFVLISCAAVHIVHGQSDASLLSADFGEPFGQVDLDLLSGSSTDNSVPERDVSVLGEEVEKGLRLFSVLGGESSAKEAEYIVTETSVVAETGTSVGFTEAVMPGEELGIAPVTEDDRHSAVDTVVDAVFDVLNDVRASYGSDNKDGEQAGVTEVDFLPGVEVETEVEDFVTEEDYNNAKLGISARRIDSVPSRTKQGLLRPGVKVQSTKYKLQSVSSEEDEDDVFLIEKKPMNMRIGGVAKDKILESDEGLKLPSKPPPKVMNFEKPLVYKVKPGTKNEPGPEKKKIPYSKPIKIQFLEEDESSESLPLPSGKPVNMRIVGISKDDTSSEPLNTPEAGVTAAKIFPEAFTDVADFSTSPVKLGLESASLVTTQVLSAPSTDAIKSLPTITNFNDNNYDITTPKEDNKYESSVTSATKVRITFRPFRLFNRQTTKPTTASDIQDSVTSESSHTPVSSTVPFKRSTTHFLVDSKPISSEAPGFPPPLIAIGSGEVPADGIALSTNQPLKLKEASQSNLMVEKFLVDSVREPLVINFDEREKAPSNLRLGNEGDVTEGSGGSFQEEYKEGEGSQAAKVMLDNRSPSPLVEELEDELIPATEQVLPNIDSVPVRIPELDNLSEGSPVVVVTPSVFELGDELGEGEEKTAISFKEDVPAYIEEASANSDTFDAVSAGAVPIASGVPSTSSENPNKRVTYPRLKYSKRPYPKVSIASTSTTEIPSADALSDSRKPIKRFSTSTLNLTRNSAIHRRTQTLGTPSPAQHEILPLENFWDDDTIQKWKNIPQLYSDYGKRELKIKVLKEAKRVRHSVGDILYDFSALTFPINKERLCRVRKVQMMIMIFSLPENLEMRNKIRKTWIKDLNITETDEIKYAFLLPESPELKNEILQEQKTFGDIVQSDSPKSELSVVFLKWVSDHCPRAQLVFRVDDDVFVNVDNFLNSAKRISDFNAVYGLRSTHLLTERGEEGLGRETWPWRTLPPYLESSMLLIGGEAVPRLYGAAQTIPHINHEGIYLSSLLAQQAGVKRYLYKRFFGEKREFEISNCVTDYLDAFKVISFEHFETVSEKLRSVKFQNQKCFGSIDCVENLYGVCVSLHEIL